jgi:hypothetical protein
VGFLGIVGIFLGIPIGFFPLGFFRRAVLAIGANPKRAVESQAKPSFRRSVGLILTDGAADRARPAG